MQYLYIQHIYNNRPVKIRMLITSLSKYADVVARKDRSKWHLEWHHDKIVVVFARRDDWRFFNATYMDKHKWTLQQDGLIPRSPAVPPLPARSTSQKHGSTSTPLLDQIRARLKQG